MLNILHTRILLLLCVIVLHSAERPALDSFTEENAEGLTFIAQWMNGSFDQGSPGMLLDEACDALPQESAAMEFVGKEGMQGTNEKSTKKYARRVNRAIDQRLYVQGDRATIWRCQANLRKKRSGRLIKTIKEEDRQSARNLFFQGRWSNLELEIKELHKLAKDYRHETQKKRNDIRQSVPDDDLLSAATRFEVPYAEMEKLRKLGNAASLDTQVREQAGEKNSVQQTEYMSVPTQLEQFLNSLDKYVPGRFLAPSETTPVGEVHSQIMGQ